MMVAYVLGGHVFQCLCSSERGYFPPVFSVFLATFIFLLN